MKRIIGLLIAIAACDSPTIPASRDVYGYELATPEPRVLRWPAGTTVNVFVAEQADAARTEALRAGLANGVESWNSAVLFSEVQLRETRNLSDADALLTFSGTALPIDVSNCLPSSTAAATTFCLTQDDAHLEVFPIIAGGGGRVKFVVTIGAVSPSDPTHVLRLVAHELGHVLGLAQHSPNSADLMHERADVAIRPTARDRATLQALYHTQPEITP